MRELIISNLKQIEKDYNVRVLLAVESGSRAWGFASPDSDYDVRFIYVRPETEYLRLEAVRDVIELPVNDELDINGWDLQKTLRLLYRSNPTLFEWFSSPIVYVETEFVDQFRKIMTDYFSTKKSLYHYISMAESNYREYLKGEMVKATQPNAYKFETFLFDAFERLDEIGILRYYREECFAPIKNAEGADSPETARALYETYYDLK